MYVDVDVDVDGASRTVYLSQLKLRGKIKEGSPAAGDGTRQRVVWSGVDCILFIRGGGCNLQGNNHLLQQQLSRTQLLATQLKIFEFFY